MSAFIYVLGNSRRGVYKVGRHTGSEKRLVSRYITALIDPTVHLFVKCDAARVERLVLTKMSAHRLVNVRGRKSEWIRADLSTIIAEVQSALDRE